MFGSVLYAVSGMRQGSWNYLPCIGQLLYSVLQVSKRRERKKTGSAPEITKRKTKLIYGLNRL